MLRLIVTIHADFSPDGRHGSVFLGKYTLCSMRYELIPCTWRTDRRPRDDPARVVGMSGAVRRTSGHMRDYWSVGGSDRQFCYHPYTHTHTQETSFISKRVYKQVHCGNALRMGSSNSSWKWISFACISVAFLAGIISCSTGTTFIFVFYVWVSVYHTLIYIKKTNLMQSSSMFIGNCKIALHVSAAFCVHLQEH